MSVTVAGAGLAGAAAGGRGHAEEIFEARGHIGGNCYGAWQDGVMVHQYGPHCFHTDKPEVWEL